MPASIPGRRGRILDILENLLIPSSSPPGCQSSTANGRFGPSTADKNKSEVVALTNQLQTQPAGCGRQEQQSEATASGIVRRATNSAVRRVSPLKLILTKSKKKQAEDRTWLSGLCLSERPVEPTNAAPADPRTELRRPPPRVDRETLGKSSSTVVCHLGSVRTKLFSRKSNPNKSILAMILHRSSILA